MWTLKFLHILIPIEMLPVYYCSAAEFSTVLMYFMYNIYFLIDEYPIFHYCNASSFCVTSGTLLWEFL